jgi:hypothetical protein
MYVYVDGNRCTQENNGDVRFNSYLCTYDSYSPVHYVLAACISITRASGGLGWALEIESFMGPVKWHRAYRRVPFGAQKTRTVQISAGSCCPDTSRCISGTYGVDMYRQAQLVSDFIEASRNFFSLKRQPKIFEN